MNQTERQPTRPMRPIAPKPRKLSSSLVLPSQHQTIGGGVGITPPNIINSIFSDTPTTNLVRSRISQCAPVSHDIPEKRDDTVRNTNASFTEKMLPILDDEGNQKKVLAAPLVEEMEVKECTANESDASLSSSNSSCANESSSCSSESSSSSDESSSSFDESSSSSSESEDDEIDAAAVREPVRTSTPSTWTVLPISRVTNSVILPIERQNDLKDKKFRYLEDIDTWLQQIGLNGAQLNLSESDSSDSESEVKTEVSVCVKTTEHQIPKEQQEPHKQQETASAESSSSSSSSSCSTCDGSSSPSSDSEEETIKVASPTETSFTEVSQKETTVGEPVRTDKLKKFKKKIKKTITILLSDSSSSDDDTTAKTQVKSKSKSINQTPAVTCFNILKRKASPIKEKNLKKAEKFTQVKSKSINRTPAVVNLKRKASPIKDKNLKQAEKLIKLQLKDSSDYNRTVNFKKSRKDLVNEVIEKKESVYGGDESFKATKKSINGKGSSTAQKKSVYHLVKESVHKSEKIVEKKLIYSTNVSSCERSKFGDERLGDPKKKLEFSIKNYKIPKKSSNKESEEKNTQTTVERSSRESQKPKEDRTPITNNVSKKDRKLVIKSELDWSTYGSRANIKCEDLGSAHQPTKIRVKRPPSSLPRSSSDYGFKSPLLTANKKMALRLVDGRGRSGSMSHNRVRNIASHRHQL